MFDSSNEKKKEKLKKRQLGWILARAVQLQTPSWPDSYFIMRDYRRGSVFSPSLSELLYTLTFSSS